jgi:N-acetylmuramoyl-L-alanine amidase
MSTPNKYNEGDPALKGLKYILTIKENGLYKYYYSVTNFASIKEANLKTAKDAGFKNATAISFIPNQKMNLAITELKFMQVKKNCLNHLLF